MDEKETRVVTDGIPDEPPPRQYTCHVCGLQYMSNECDKHNGAVCFDRAFAARAEPLRLRIVELERAQHTELKDAAAKAAELARAQGRNDSLEYTNKRQAAEFAQLITANAEKVGEAISLKIQYGALKAEHAKCASVVNTGRIQELEGLLAKQSMKLGTLHAEKNALLDELAEARADDEPDEDTFTLDDVRDVIRDELKKSGFKGVVARRR